jgi:hypothetical protein
MMSGHTRGWFRRAYDKLIASVILLALVASLFMLAFNAQTLKKRQAEFDAALRQLKPRHPVAEVVDRSAFQLSLMALTDPFQVPERPLRLLVPELRVRCVNCERPIPFAATNCFFCKTDQGGGGSKDPFREWCEKNGLNPLDADVGKADTDHDGFANREEYEFKTDPRDPSNHPPALATVGVGSITPIPFRLIFKGVTKLTAEKKVFQINLRANERTWLKSLGEEVEGFKLVEFDEKSPDGPVLTLQRGEKKIPLIKGRPVPRDEYEVLLRSRLPNVTIPPVRMDSIFDLKGVKYGVKKVDMDGMRVLIHDPSRDMDVWIGRAAPEPQSAP